MSVRRRELLKFGGLLACTGGLSLLAGAARAVASEPPAPRGRRLALRNLHTDESLEIEYCCDAVYDPAALARLDHFLRDFRNDAEHPIDPRLFDTLFEAAAGLGADPVFSVISGYRSPQTNQHLRSRSHGVAQHSLHMEGRAIDVRLAGVDCRALAAHAELMACGGVGYYRASNFVHLDTGALRTWRG